MSKTRVNIFFTKYKIRVLLQQAQVIFYGCMLAMCAFCCIHTVSAMFISCYCYKNITIGWLIFFFFFISVMVMCGMYFSLSVFVNIYIYTPLAIVNVKLIKVKVHSVVDGCHKGR